MVLKPVLSRRGFVYLAGSGVLSTMAGSVLFGPAKAAEQEVAANEDLMREHGVLRRILLCYRETATRIREDPGAVPLKPLHDAAILFRRFGEEYHEKALEEAYVFSVVRRTGGEAASYPDILQLQHTRGRELTERILALTGQRSLNRTETDTLATTFSVLDLMYENHAAREDTIVFPAWKERLGEREYREMGEKFESLERQFFGNDGFEQALKQTASIERALGYANLAQFTPSV